MIVALFDLDGTLADYDGQLRRDLQHIAGPDDPPIDWLKYGMPEYLDRRRRVITSQPGWFANLPKHEPGFQLLELAEAIGFEVHILTKGPRGNRAAWSEKVQWCDVHVPGRPIHVVSDKSLSYGRVLVDDWPQYFLPWLAWRPRGLVVAPAHPWNEGVDHTNLIRFTGDNLEQVRDRLQRSFDRKDGEA